MNEKNTGLMTEGPILKKLLAFAFPLLLGNLFQQLYNTVDSVIVGKYIGSEALASVNSSGPIINLLIAMFMGVSMGGSVIISQYFGAKNNKKLKLALHTTVAFALISGFILTFIGVIFSPTILRAMGTPEDIMDKSSLYLRIYFSGILGIIVYNICSGILRAVGDSKKPLYFLIVSSLVNIILDLIFVVNLNMGVAGVALATLISQFISASLVLYVLVRTKEVYSLKIKEIKVHKEYLKKIIRIGLPSGLQGSIVSFSNVVVQSNINNFGAIAMAGCGSYTKIDGFAILPIMSLSMALTTFTGQNIGAKQYDRVHVGSKIGLKLTVIITFTISGFLYIFAPHVLKIFSNDPEVIKYGVLMLQTLAPAYIFLATSNVLSGILRGAGKTTVPMIVMIACWCFMRVGWILVLVPIFNDIRVVFAAYAVTWVSSAVILYIYFKKSNWISSLSEHK
ncbi:MAG: MATE family efflux transporter [Clostridium sp.]